jgi:hypothetical protein
MVFVSVMGQSPTIPKLLGEHVATLASVSERAYNKTIGHVII